MQKRPLTFKGPIDHLSRRFDEKGLFKGLDLLLNDKMKTWQHSETSDSVFGEFSDGSNQATIVTNLYWPLTPDLGDCSCNLVFPCAHLAALAIETKSRLDRIPLQMKDLPSINHRWQQCKRWLKEQHFDPYPNMARHRLVYLLKVEHNRCYVSLAKAYLNKDGSYTKKASFPLELAFKKTLPKFITLEDRRILQLFWNILTADINFNPNDSLISLKQSHAGKILPLIFQTGRCFWRTCHTKPLELQETNQLTEQAIPIIGNYYFEKHQGAVHLSESEPEFSSMSNQVELTGDSIEPSITLDTVQVILDWLPEHPIEFDIANVRFSVTNQGAKKTYSFSQLNQLDLLSDDAQHSIAGFCKQLEAMPTISASFESPISELFDINDRCLFEDFSHTATTLKALKQEGWAVKVSDGFRLRWQHDLDQSKQSQHEWYVHLDDASLAEQGWFDLELGVIVDGKSVNLIPIILKSLRSGQIKLESEDPFYLLRLEDNSPLLLPRDRLRTICNTLTELRDSRLLTKTEKLQLPANQVSRLTQLSQPPLNQTRHEVNKEDHQIHNNNLYQWQGATWLKDKADKLRDGQLDKKSAPPENLQAQLRDYQQYGLNWLQFLDSFGFSGILADDMGLGKTLQSLAYILTLKHQKQLKTPCLVIVPTSLLSNWQNEIRQYTPDLSSIVIKGADRKKLWSIANQYDVIIISYGHLLRDQQWVLKQSFRLLILDEAQTIKNHRTKIANLVYRLNSVQRLCLTGTPLENHLSELWSLFHFLMPGFLGDHAQFRQLFQDPIEKEQDYLRQRVLAERISPFMLRRTKNEVATELPAKTVITEWIELEQQQRDLYEVIRSTMDQQVREAIHQNSKGSNQLLISNAILRLRQICCHPQLINMESSKQISESVKLNWLATVLPEMVAEGRKVLLFSQFTSMLDLIAKQLDQLGISHLMLTGRTKERGPLVERFQSGEADVFLISLKAGGVGLNLTTADTVIHFDPWWNPAAVEQASDRAHRIGQDKPVFVYQLITKGTVEERIYKMQLQKTQLAEGIYNQSQVDPFELSQGDWLSLLGPLPEFG